MKITHLLRIVAVGSALVFSTLAFAQPITLTLHRPYTVGETYQRQVELDEAMVVTVQSEGQADTQETRRVRVRFKAAMRVLSINAKGQPTSELMRIDQCELAVGDGAMESVVEPGRRITARLVGGLTIFRPQEGRLSPEASMALGYAIAYPTQVAGTLTDHLDPGRMVQIGQTWPANALAMSRSFSQGGLRVEPGNLLSTVTYEKMLKAFGDVPCYQLAETTEVNDFDFTDTQVPAIRDTAMNIRTTITLPIDPASRYGRQQRMATIRFTSSPAPGIAMDHVIDRSMTATTSPLKGN